MLTLQTKLPINCYAQRHQSQKTKFIIFVPRMGVGYITLPAYLSSPVLAILSIL
jgi:hypothetical protein